MAYNCEQFRAEISRLLIGLGRYSPETVNLLHSPTAVNLLLGTAAKESDFGTYFRQIGGGPGLGAFQIEPKTFLKLQRMFGDKYPLLWHRQPEELVLDLSLGITTARLLYFTIKVPLPDADDVEALGAYWDKYYNRNPDVGTVAEFVQKYRQYVTAPAI